MATRYPRTCIAGWSRPHTDSCPLTAAASGCYAGGIVFSRERILDALTRVPFIDAGELALVLDEPLATVHRVLTGLLIDDLAGRVSQARPICLPATATTLRGLCT